MGAFGPIHIILIVIVALLLFGPSKLPELGKAFGKTLREFKNGTKDIMSDHDDAPQAKPELRKEIRSEKANVQEAQYREVNSDDSGEVIVDAKQNTANTLDKKPQDNRRLPD